MALSKIQSESVNLADDFAGMHFGGTADANQLDDYEEGTWTVVVEGASTAGTGTYTSQDATYVKVGKVITLNFDYAITAHTGSGALRIKGLPYASASTSSRDSTGSCMLSNFNFSGTPLNVSLFIGTTFDHIRVYITQDSLSWAQQNLDVSHSLIGSITYITD